MLWFDLLIPTAGTLHPLEGLLSSLLHQTVLPQRVVLLVWKDVDAASIQTFSYAVHKLLAPLLFRVDILSHLNTDHQLGQGVGYDRNFLLSQTKEDYLCMIDEDNELPEDFFLHLSDEYQSVSQKLGCPCIVSPTIMQGHTGQIQSQGIADFSFRFPRYTFGRIEHASRHHVKMIGANSLFGRTESFQRLGFDPRFRGSYEDIDFSYRAYLSGIPVVVLRDLPIYHMERPKSRMEQVFVWAGERGAYFRSRNRVLFVKKNATRWQKIGYFLFGLQVQTLRFLRLALRYGKSQRWKLCWAVLKGTWDGMRQ